MRRSRRTRINYLKNRLLCAYLTRPRRKKKVSSSYNYWRELRNSYWGF